MSLGTSNRDGGKTSESGHLRSIMKGYLGQVLSGLNVSQRGAGANMSVDIAIGDAIIPRSDGTYGHPAFNDAVLNQVITTADPSNPRRDILVMYIDYANAVSTGVSNNTNGVVKVKVVAGTPAGSPVDPTNAAIQSSVGASNPYIKLSRIRVGTGVTSIGNSVIDDLRVMASGMLQGGWNYDATNTWVYVSATSFKVAGLDVTAQFPVGTKIQVYQGNVVAYFVVTAGVFSTDTTITIDGKGTYTLANNIIDRPAYSYDLGPSGWPFPSVQSSNMNVPYKADVYLPTGQSIGASTWTKVNLGTVNFDTGANFDAVTNRRFTAPVSGFYLVNGNIRLTDAGASTGSMEGAVYKNGSVYIDSPFLQASGNGNQRGGGSFARIIQLSAGDFIELYGWIGEAGRNIAGGNDKTFLSIALHSKT